VVVPLQVFRPIPILNIEEEATFMKVKDYFMMLPHLLERTEVNP
jgi:hypothetical protein